MSPALESSKLESAFADRTDIQESIKKAATNPQLINLFNDISSYVSELRTTSASSLEHVAKKRRLNDNNDAEINIPDHHLNGSTNGASEAVEEDTEEALLAVQDISVVIPQRKKYTIEFTKTKIRARDPKTKELVSGVGCKWADIEHVFLLPVPEKSQKQFNYVLLPAKSFLPTSKTNPQTDVPEPLIFTIPSTAPKPATLSGTDIAPANDVSDDYKSLFDWAINRQLQVCSKKVKIVEANERQFHSVLRQPHRPGEKAVHVKAFRGSKDGYLFFLESGILWGFKKPVLLLPIDRIASVAYTSVLQRTFNLTLEVFVDGSEGEEKEELEFAMLDQEDFAGIDGYVRRYGLQDGSMAVARKAKREGVNVVRNEEGEVVGVEEGGHLARAAAEGGIGDEMEGHDAFGAEDEEDEEEEDYDPGSEGESEGSGSSSEEEDEDGGGGGDEGGDDEGSVASDDMLGDDA